MNSNTRSAIGMILLSVSFFALILDCVFPYTMIIFRILFFIFGLLCFFASMGYISDILNTKRNHINEDETIVGLIFKSGLKTSIVNLFSLYRIIISPLLLFLLFTESPLFKWFLLSAFLTDAIDGFLARMFKVSTKLGAKLDSIADDCLFVVSLIAIIIIHPILFIENNLLLSVTGCIFIVKIIALYKKHRKFISGLHTYASKFSAISQALFFIHAQFFQPSNVLFYIAIFSTIFALIEEIIIIQSFTELKQNSKGIFFKNN